MMNRNLRIVIAEDDVVIAILLGDLLTDMGHQVCAIADNETGTVTETLRCKPDLMIVDARLGKGSGISAVAKILPYGFIPHIMVSGGGLNRIELDPRAVVLQKPYRERDLTSAIQQVMADGNIAHIFGDISLALRA